MCAVISPAGQDSYSIHEETGSVIGVYKLFILFVKAAQRDSAIGMPVSDFTVEILLCYL